MSERAKSEGESKYDRKRQTSIEFSAGQQIDGRLPYTADKKLFMSLEKFQKKNNRSQVQSPAYYEFDVSSVSSSSFVNWQVSHNVNMLMKQFLASTFEQLFKPARLTSLIAKIMLI